MDFIQLTKVAEDQQIIYARAICEEVDRANQIADYEASKLAFQKWSNETKEASMGKSLGNIRVMHKPQAAGRVIDIQFDDANKAIDVAVQVDDPAIWKMCKAGTYTGLSVGGSYGRKWVDELTGAERYEPRLSEISIVDRPCVPSATFQLLKADGAVEERHFANITFDSDIIDTLKSMVSEHNDEHRAAWSKAKLADLKKVFKRGTLSVLEKAEGANPLVLGLERVTEFLAALSANATYCQDKDLLAKNHPVIVHGGELLAKKRYNPNYEDPNSTGKKVGAATGAVISGGLTGYAARGVGGVVSAPAVSAVMLANKKAKKNINATHDALVAASRGFNRTAATGSFRAGIKTARRSFQAAQSGRTAVKASAKLFHPMRGARSVPGLAIGTLAGLAVAGSTYRKNRAGQKSSAEIHNAIVGVQKLAKEDAKALIGRKAIFEAGTLGASTALGAAAGAAAAYKGNPYRDKDGKFTSKAKAAIVIGIGATAGAVAGFGGGLAITNRGMSQIHAEAEDAANAALTRYINKRRMLTDAYGYNGSKFKLNEAINNVRNKAKAEHDVLSRTHSNSAIEKRHTSAAVLAEQELLTGKHRAEYVKNGKITAAGRQWIVTRAKDIKTQHENLEKEVSRTGVIAGQLKVPGKDASPAEIAKFKQDEERVNGNNRDAVSARDEFVSKLDAADEIAESRINQDKSYAQKRFAQLLPIMKGTVNGVTPESDEGVNKVLSDLYQRSADLHEAGDKEVPTDVADFRKVFETKIKAEHAKLLSEVEARYKKAKRSGSPKAADRFKRAYDRRTAKIAETNDKLENIKKARDNVFSARVLARLHNLVSPMKDAARPLANEAKAATGLALNAMKPNTQLNGVYANTRRKIHNALAWSFLKTAGKYEDGPEKGYYKVTHRRTPFGGIEIPEVDPLKMPIVAGVGALAGTGIVFKEKQKDGTTKWSIRKPKDIKPHFYTTGTQHHVSLTVGSHLNPQSHFFLAGATANTGGNPGMTLFHPGQTATPNLYLVPQQNYNQNQNSGQRQLPSAQVSPDDIKKIHAWNTLSSDNNLIVNNSEYGTKYRKHGGLSQDQNTIANEAANATRNALTDVINKQGKPIPAGAFYPLVKQITGSAPIKIGNETHSATALTARDQANVLKRIIPTFAGLQLSGDRQQAQEQTFGALKNAIDGSDQNKRIPGTGKIAENELALKGMVNTFAEGQLITNKRKEDLMAAIESRSLKDKQFPGQNQTTSRSDVPFSLGDDKYVEGAMSELTSKYPDIPSVALQSMLNRHIRDQRVNNPDLEHSQRVTEAKEQVIDEIDRHQ